MSPKKATNVVEMTTSQDDAGASDQKDGKPQTDKKILKRMEIATRRLDKVVSDLGSVNDTLSEITFASTEISPKDSDRLAEMNDVVRSAQLTLYHLAARMARKYVGKDIEPVDQNKRKSLKQK